ncbi:MAG: ATP-binding protein [Rhodospirillales bacterium]
MSAGLSLFLGLLNNLSVFIVLVAGYGFINEQRRLLDSWRLGLTLGLFFGLIAVIAMHVKIPVVEGVIVDQRNAVVALCGAFAGPVAAVISAALASSYRLYLGGGGAFAGFVGVWLAASAGILLYFLRRPDDGIMRAACGSLLAMLIILPGFLLVGDLADGWDLLKRVWLPYGGAIFVGMFASALLLLREDLHRLLELERVRGEQRFKNLFENSEVSIWSEDFSQVNEALNDLKQRGVQDLRQYLQSDPMQIEYLAKLVKVDRVNAATLRLYRVASEAQFIASLRDVLGPEGKEVFVDALVAIWNGETNFRVETTHRTLDGEELTVILSMPIPDIDAGFSDLPVTVLDISDRKRAEDARDQALKAAEQANQAKSEFLATMSHELRTPLNAILGFSEVLSMQSLGPPGKGQYKEYAGYIHSSGELLLELVNDLLDISTIEAGARTLNVSPMQVGDVIVEVLAIIEERAAHNGIKVVKTIPADLPDIAADRRAMKQVILNLISNAVKFTPKDGDVTVQVKPNGGWMEIIVSDTGHGIDPEVLSEVVNPFVRGEKDPHKTHDGWGLGLAIAKSLVELHQGKISIESKVGVGTEVTVRLPYKQE